MAEPMSDATPDPAPSADTTPIPGDRDRAPSPRPRLPIVFVIGAARSGTTWLSRALGGDPRVAATYESHLMNAYVTPLLQTWRDHERTMADVAERWRTDNQPPHIAIGLPFLVTEEQLLDGLRGLVTSVFDAVADDDPTAEVIVEKTPSHSAHVAEIEQLLGPEVRYVHIVRDGYDVVGSTLAAGRGWAADWAPTDVMTAARKWAAAVTSARDAAAFGDRYFELRYEDLVAEPEARLTDVFRFMGLDADRSTAEAALAATDSLHLGGQAARHFDGPFPEPSGFRRGERDRPERLQVLVNAAAGPLLTELGYHIDPDVSPARRRAWLAAGTAATTYGRVARQVDRVRRDVAERAG